MRAPPESTRVATADLQRVESNSRRAHERLDPHRPRRALREDAEHRLVPPVDRRRDVDEPFVVDEDLDLARREERVPPHADVIGARNRLRGYVVGERDGNVLARELHREASLEHGRDLGRREPLLVGSAEGRRPVDRERPREVPREVRVRRALVGLRSTSSTAPFFFACQVCKAAAGLFAVQHQILVRRSIRGAQESQPCL